MPLAALCAVAARLLAPGRPGLGAGARAGRAVRRAPRNGPVIVTACPIARRSSRSPGAACRSANPDKVYFPQTGHTKLDLVRYYLSVADGALRGVAGRPMVLKRYVNGAEGEAFFQKRAPSSRPDWIETVELSFPSGRTAEEVVVTDAAGLAWVANLGCIDLNPHPVRADDLDHPDELRVDLDPVPGVDWAQIIRVALVAREVLADFGLTGWPKTSGSRGMHVYARIEPRWTFAEVRRAAVALAREIERRAPQDATVPVVEGGAARRVRRLQPERQGPHGRLGVLGQAHPGRPGVGAADLGRGSGLPARRSSPSTRCRERFARLGDVGAGIDAAAGSLEPLLELAARDEAAGLPDAPWPPHFVKQADEQPRVQPSKRRAPAASPPPERPAGAPAGPGSRPAGRRRSSMPLIEVARAASKDEAMAGLDRWKQRHPEAWARLEPADVLVDSMRGRSSTWTRIRLNLRNVPEAERPPQEPLEVDYDPWAPRPQLTGARDPPEPDRPPAST